MNQHLDLDALQSEIAALRNSERSRMDINCDVLAALIDRLRKAEAASMPGHVIVPAEQFLAVLDRSDWRTAKNRAELRAMIAAPDSTPTDSAENTKGGAA